MIGWASLAASLAAPGIASLVRCSVPFAGVEWRLKHYGVSTARPTRRPSRKSASISLIRSSVRRLIGIGVTRLLTNKSHKLLRRIEIANIRPYDRYGAHRNKGREIVISPPKRPTQNKCAAFGQTIENGIS
jgi:hypothetical protein